MIYAHDTDAKVKCEQPSSQDPMLQCGMPAYGQVSPGNVWTHACYHHFEKAKRSGWEWKRP